MSALHNKLGMFHQYDMEVGVTLLVVGPLEAHMGLQSPMV